MPSGGAAGILPAGPWSEARSPDEPEPPTVEVVDATTDSLVLRPDGAPDSAIDDLHGDLVVGLDTEDGYVRLSGAPVDVTDDVVERSGALVQGTWPDTGDAGRMDVYAWPDDPTTTGLDVTDVTASGPLGDLPGWEFPGAGATADDWLVYVHGRGGSRSTASRTLPTVVTYEGGHARGWNVDPPAYDRTVSDFLSGS